MAPFGVVDFVQAISHLFSVPGSKPLGRVVAVVGAKGGVGASTVAHNLAWSIASVTDMATVIADLDLAFGTAGLDFNQDPPQGVGDAVFAPERVDAVLVDRLLSKCGANLNLLAAPATLDRSWIFPRPPSIRCSTPCGRRPLGLFLTCLTCGQDGRESFSYPPTKWSSLQALILPTFVTRKI